MSKITLGLTSYQYEQEQQQEREEKKVQDKVNEERYKALQKRQQALNLSRLDTAKTEAASRSYIASYNIIAELPDSILDQSEVNQIRMKALRQAVASIDENTTRKILEVIPTDQLDTPNVKSAEALLAYKKETRHVEDSRRDSIKMEREKTEFLEKTYEVFGIISRKIDENLYECNYSNGRIFLLKTTGTRFESTGRFGLWVSNIGTTPVNLERGFDTDADVLLEVATIEEMRQLKVAWRSTRAEFKEKIPLLIKQQKIAKQRLIQQARRASIQLQFSE